MIKNCDFLNGMQEIEDNSIDAIITDPPYMITKLCFEFVLESLRVIKNDGYLAIFAPIEMQAKIAETFSIRFSGVWLKTIPTMKTGIAKKPMSKQELFVVYAHPKYHVSKITWNPIKNWGYEPYKTTRHNSGYGRKVLFRTDDKNTNSIDQANSAFTKTDGYDHPGFRYQTDVIEAPNKSAMEHSEKTLHPTQKPIQVINILTKWLTNAGDIILDPFMGTGTTGIVAQQLERKFIGFEINSEYFEIAEYRIDTALDSFQDSIDI